MSINKNLYETLESQSGRAGDLLDLETEEARYDAASILDEWSYGETDDTKVLLTDYLNDNLQSVHEELLYVSFCDTTLTEGTLAFH